MTFRSNLGTSLLPGGEPVRVSLTLLSSPPSAPAASAWHMAQSRAPLLATVHATVAIPIDKTYTLMLKIVVRSINTAEILANARKIVGAGGSVSYDMRTGYLRRRRRSSGTDRRLRTQECVWESLAGFLGRNRVLPTRRLCSRIARRLGIRGTAGLPSRRRRRRWW